tara:strand:- start:1266 stop:2057 length:792 start_codon:yes stop_codon:yes gene_type:complete
MSDIVEVQPEIPGAEAPNQPTADPENATTVEATSEETAAVESSDRPEWLPEKFQSAEDLASAYKELESKLGQPKEEVETTEEEAPKQEEESDEWTDKFAPFTKELEEKGELSEESYADLTKQGYPKQLVDQWIAGQQALQTLESQQEGEIVNSIGGQENFDSMIEWVKENVSPAEIEAYDRAVTGGTQADAQVAVQGMYARYQAATGEGSAPKLITGQKGDGKGKAIRSNAELVELMGDPRYHSDPAYRQDVERRLAVSDILN